MRATSMNGVLDWTVFASNFKGKTQESFEMLAYHMFCRKFSITEGLPAFYNQKHIETNPYICADGTIVGFQAKYYSTNSITASHKKELINAIEGAAETYRGISQLIFYISKPFSQSPIKGQTKTKMQIEIEEKAKSLGIAIEWVLPSNFEAILNRQEYSDLREYFFETEFSKYYKKINKMLIDHCNNTYAHSGNYILHEIHKELFADIKDEQKNVVYTSDGSRKLSLFKYIKSSTGRETILLKGAGGMGKTISMIQTCKKLLEEGIYAVYIPLSKIGNREQVYPIKEFIRKYIFGCDNSLFEWFERIAGSETSGSVYLFLDGVNEFSGANLNSIYEFIRALHFSKEWSGTRVILSSRIDLDLPDLTVLEMLPLRDTMVTDFLSKCELSVPKNEKVFSLINNPLMLALYADSEKYAELYNIEGRRFSIRLDPQPDTATKIISNFMQTQLFKMASMSNQNEDFILYHALLDYVLPSIAYQMIHTDRLLTEQEIRDTLMLVLNDRYRHFIWYDKEILNKLRWDYGVRNESIANRIIEINYFAIKKFRFLCLNQSDYDEENTVEFLHQEFRDYFAGVYFANEVKMMCKRQVYLDDVPFTELGISKGVADSKILEYCGGVLHEDRACPVSTKDGFYFPGKREKEPSIYSVVEKVLSNLKKEKEEFCPGISTVIANMMGILRISRKNNLAQCDFSYLDLRQCRMNGCHFSEFYKNTLYTSDFEGAFISDTFFFNPGHSSMVCSIAEGLNGWIFSADYEGNLIRWNYKIDETYYIKKYQGIPKAIVFNRDKNQLCIVLNNQIALIECVNYTEVYSRYNETWTKEFRYVKYDHDNSVKFAYDIEPTIWYDLLTGNKEEGYTSELPVSGCVCECREKNTIVFSLFGRNICVRRYQDKSSQETTFIDDIKRIWFEAPLLLDDASKRISSISLSKDRKRFIISIGKKAFEYSLDYVGKLEDQKPIWEYSCNSSINDINYLNGGGFVLAAGRDVIILSDKGIVINKLVHQPIGKIVMFSASSGRELNNCDGTVNETFYLVSEDKSVKELDGELKVRRIRHINYPARFIWVEDKMNKEVQMLFGRNKSFPYGYRFSFPTGEIVPSGWCFNVLTTHENVYRRQFVLNKSRSVSVYDIRNKDSVFEYINHTGIWIFGCSFKGIKGTMSATVFLRYLKSNGGIIDELSSSTI